MGNKTILDCAIDASNFFYVLLEDYFYTEEDYDMEVFTEFCMHIKTTYQNFYNGADKHLLYIHMLKPFEQLVKIANYNVAIDVKHEAVVCLAHKTVNAILNIVRIDSDANKIQYRDIVWYDFEKDTPEDVFDRLMEYFIDDEEDDDF